MRKRRPKEMVKGEKKDLSRLGAKPTPNSGALPGQRADGIVRTRDEIKWRIEHKSVETGKFRMTPTVFRKLFNDSAKSLMGTPAFLIHFVPEGKKLVLVPDWEYYVPGMKEYYVPHTLTPDMDTDILLSSKPAGKCTSFPSLAVLSYDIGSKIINGEE